MLRLQRGTRLTGDADRRQATRRLPTTMSLGAVVTVLASLLLTVGPQAAAGDTSAAAANGPLPPFTGIDQAAYTRGTTTVTKAKTTIALPLLLLRVDSAAEHVYVPPGPTAVYLFTKSDAWVVSPPGSAHPYGLLPDFTTSVLAFGTIPVTATVHLAQVFTNNHPQPLLVDAQGMQVAPFTIFPTIVTGKLTMRISDVTVDRVPLDVGPDCHTSSALTLRVSGIDPGYDLFNGGTLTGTTTIPSFTGCGVDGQDLSPLLTGMISGPKNPVAMQQGVLGTWLPPGGCNTACTIP